MTLNLSSSRAPCTILLPLYNGANFLNRSIENLSAIAGPDDEILVIDDGSTDISIHEVEEIKRRDPRIVIHIRDHRGLVDSLNFGISIARNELIARADVDDTYDLNRISDQVKFLTEHSDISAVFSDYRVQSESGSKLGFFPSAIFPELTAFSLITSRRTAHPSVMYRKSAVVAAGCYLQTDFPTEDLALWMRLVEKGKIASLPHTLLNYTVHTGSITQSKQEIMRTKSNELRKEFALKKENRALLDNIESQLDLYDNYPHKNFRVLFVLEDLICFNRFTGGRYRRRVFSIIFFQILSRNFLLVPCIFSVLFMKMKRALISLD